MSCRLRVPHYKHPLIPTDHREAHRGRLYTERAYSTTSRSLNEVMKPLQNGSQHMWHVKTKTNPSTHWFRSESRCRDMSVTRWLTSRHDPYHGPFSDRPHTHTPQRPEGCLACNCWVKPAVWLQGPTKTMHNGPGVACVSVMGSWIAFGGVFRGLECSRLLKSIVVAGH